MLEYLLTLCEQLPALIAARSRLLIFEQWASAEAGSRNPGRGYRPDEYVRRLARCVRPPETELGLTHASFE